MGKWIDKPRQAEGTGGAMEIRHTHRSPKEVCHPVSKHLGENCLLYYTDVFFFIKPVLLFVKRGRKIAENRQEMALFFEDSSLALPRCK